MSSRLNKGLARARMRRRARCAGCGEVKLCQLVWPRSRQWACPSCYPAVFRAGPPEGHAS